MSDVILGICAGIVITFFVSPYFSLWRLNGIANSLENIETELHEISKQLKRIAEKEKPE